MANAKLAWQSLTSDNQNISEDLRGAIAQVEEGRALLEKLVKVEKPAPKGRKWAFSYKFGVAIALADASGGSASYF